MQQGYVQKLSTKQGQGRNGPYTMYNVNIDGEWYGHGFKPPQCNEGDYVQFNVIQKGQYKNADSISVVANNNVASAPAPASAPVAALPVNKKDVSIHFQSCRKDAIQTVGILLAHEAVKLPAKQADKFDAAMALIDEITNQNYLRLEDVINEGGVKVEDVIPEPGDA